MTNEEIRLIAVGVIQEADNELPVGLYAPRLCANIERAIRNAIARAYAEAVDKAENWTVPGLDERMAAQDERMQREDSIPIIESIPTVMIGQHRTARGIAASIRALSPLSP